MESFENVFIFQKKKKNRSVSRVDKRNKGEELSRITRLLPTQSNKSRDHDIFAVASRIKHSSFLHSILWISQTRVHYKITLSRSRIEKKPIILLDERNIPFPIPVTLR